MNLIDPAGSRSPMGGINWLRHSSFHYLFWHIPKSVIHTGQGWWRLGRKRNYALQHLANQAKWPSRQYPSGSGSRRCVEVPDTSYHRSLKDIAPELKFKVRGQGITKFLGLRVGICRCELRGWKGLWESPSHEICHRNNLQLALHRFPGAPLYLTLASKSTLVSFDPRRTLFTLQTGMVTVLVGVLVLLGGPTVTTIIIIWMVAPPPSAANASVDARVRVLWVVQFKEQLKKDLLLIQALCIFGITTWPLSLWRQPTTRPQNHSAAIMILIITALWFWGSNRNGSITVSFKAWAKMAWAKMDLHQSWRQHLYTSATSSQIHTNDQSAS